MNRGNWIGLIAGAAAMGFGYFFSTFVALVPSMAGFLIIMTFTCIVGGAGIIQYAASFEGNAYLRRRFGRENIGIGILVEQGAFWKFYQVDLTKGSVTLEGEIFFIDPKHIGFRRGGGIPYFVMLKGTGKTVDLATLETSLNSRTITAWLMEESAIARTLAENLFANKMFLAIIIGFIALGVLLILATFGVANPGREAAVKAVDVCSQIAAALPKATPTIAGAIANA